MGWKTYHLFMILSSMLMAAAAAMCIPYTVDGIRNHNYHLPLPVILLVLCAISFGLANLLRMAHNGIHSWRKADLKRYYQQADAFSYPDIRSAVKALADMDRPHDMGGEFTVPRRIMAMMERKYRSGLSSGELCELYISECFSEETERKQ